MDNLEERFAAIRQEIDRLKVALQTTVDDAERHEIHTRINACIRESLQLIDQRLGRRYANANAAFGNTPADQATNERSVGDKRSYD
jgi:hypothetical protein